MTYRTTDEFLEFCMECNTEDQYGHAADKIVGMLEHLRDNPATKLWQEQVLDAAIVIVGFLDNHLYDGTKPETIKNESIHVEGYLDNAVHFLSGRVLAEDEPGLHKALNYLGLVYKKAWKHEHVWVEKWVADALRFYKSNGGYADLSLFKFLSKMRPEKKKAPKEKLSPSETEYNYKLKKRVTTVDIDDEDRHEIRKKSRHKAAKLKKAMGRNGIH